MEILIKSARIMDPASPFHQQETSLLVQDGFIRYLGDSPPEASNTIDLPDLTIFPGFVDIFSHFCDPGFEHREDLNSGSAAAAAGGFTDVLILPNTKPVVHNKSAVEYLVKAGRDLPVNIHPIGAVTINNEGKELAEMYDMNLSGAKAFSDGTATIQSAGLLLKALQYLKAIEGVLIQLPDDKSISGSGLMNESIVSTRMGLQGKPALAEEVMISRDIELARYTEGRIHITGISSERSVDLIRRAKKDGVMVTCSVTPYHLIFTDEDLEGYDTNLKLNPPLRGKTDREALRNAVLNGTIDCISSHHLPQEQDRKATEFEYAAYGMTGLETAVLLVKQALPGLSDERLMELMSSRPREIFGLEKATIKEGEKAKLTLIQKEAETDFRLSQSKSRNSPFLHQKFKGKIAGTINGTHLSINS